MDYGLVGIGLNLLGGFMQMGSGGGGGMYAEPCGSYSSCQQQVVQQCVSQPTVSAAVYYNAVESSTKGSKLQGGVRYKTINGVRCYYAADGLWYNAQYMQSSSSGYASANYSAYQYQQPCYQQQYAQQCYSQPVCYQQSNCGGGANIGMGLQMLGGAFMQYGQYRNFNSNYNRNTNIVRIINKGGYGGGGGSGGSGGSGGGGCSGYGCNN